jgi:hypothetical protein
MGTGEAGRSKRVSAQIAHALGRRTRNPDAAARGFSMPTVPAPDRRRRRSARIARAGARNQRGQRSRWCAEKHRCGERQRSRRGVLRTCFRVISNPIRTTSVNAVRQGRIDRWKYWPRAKPWSDMGTTRARAPANGCASHVRRSPLFREWCRNAERTVQSDFWTASRDFGEISTRPEFL